MARAANVHPTTASSILNAASGNSRFSPETRRLVEEAAQRLGYVRNLAARNLRARKSYTVGLVAGNLQNPFFAQLSLELEKCLHPLGYELLLTCHGADNADDELRLAQTLSERGVDGLLIWSEMRGGRAPKFSAGAGCPRVFLGYGPPREPAVTIDLGKGLALAVGRLVAEGFRQIAFFSPSYARTAGLPRPRPELLQDACLRHRIPQPILLYYDGESWDFQAAVEGAMRLLPDVKCETAVIGFNDVCALAWFLAAQGKNRSAPVVGFDGTPLVQAMSSRLPFVDLRPALVAEKAAALLIQLMRGESPRSRRVSVAPLYVGDEGQYPVQHCAG
ncbi:LacI family DNA-binding transcriptional regulator [Terrimicrobium sacchariphilum]|uniref:LacI family DNA-binding transcriptional regulator n=1 Tax=Terrimicrobium sacchariphilum TaxID=690879 RepID=UPI00129A759C|nr:LacI family DNA-binding transcriptional regulator [Terrimicrobium sacchariphilum]